MIANAVSSLVTDGRAAGCRAIDLRVEGGITLRLLPDRGLDAGDAWVAGVPLDWRSPVGETLTAVREDEVSAGSLGINAKRWKVFAFAVSSAVAGAAGAFYAPFVGTLVPDAFGITESFSILAMVVVGGMGTLVGPVFGAILLTVLPELLRGLGDMRLIVYGIAVTLVVLFMPGGLVQAWHLLIGRFLSKGGRA